jgi:hypothetical protein
MKGWLIFQGLETRYFHLRRQSETGQISSQQLLAAAQQLRTQDDQGAWWQMRPEDGTWQRWNRSAWATAIPPHLTGPQTLVDFLYVLLKELFKGLLWKLPISIGTALVVWTTHTVLVVGLNEGLLPGKNALLDMILTLPGQLVPGIIFWFTLACLVSLILARIIRQGFKQVLLSMTETPAWIEYSLSEAEGNVIISLLVGCALALLLGVIVGNRLVSFLLVMVALGALISQEGSLILWGLRLAWSDGLRLLNRPSRPFNPAWGGLILIGAVFGFMGAVVLPLMPYTGCVGIFLLVGMATLWVLVRQRRRSSALGLLLAPLVMFIHPARVEPITLSDLGVVIAYGILPAWGAFCGTLLGLSLGRWERNHLRTEPGKAVPAPREIRLQSQVLSSPAPASSFAQPPSPPPAAEQIILQGQAAFDVLDRLNMIKRVTTSQGSRYFPVALEPQGPVSALAYFLDEQGFLTSQLAIGYLPPVPAPEHIEREIHAEEGLSPAEEAESSQPEEASQLEAPSPDGSEIAQEIPDDLHPPGLKQDR